MKRALVIDDDDIARELLVSVLREGGYEVFELPSPIGATQTIVNEKIDVLVLDVFMPSMDGDKFAKLLRGNPKLGNVGIVLVSGVSSDRLQGLADRVNADAVVSKADIRTRLLTAVGRAA